ncbi:membrane ATPase [Cryptosporidium felis]|nr:membrane ATPase [Cryptosporidium felis]
MSNEMHSCSHLEYVSFGGINNCIVYSVSSQSIRSSNKIKEESPNFDFPVCVSPICQRRYLQKICFLLNIISLGVFPIICHWFPNVYRWINYKSSTISECDSFLVITKEEYYTVVKKNTFLCSNKHLSEDEISLLKFLNILPSQHNYFTDFPYNLIKNNPSSISTSNRSSINNPFTVNSSVMTHCSKLRIEIIFFSFCGSIYIFDSVLNKFTITIPSLDNHPYTVIRNRVEPLLKSFRRLEPLDDSSDSCESNKKEDVPPRSSLQEIFGKCACDIPIVPIVDLIKNEILHPFFIFQIVAVLVWFKNSYVEYAVCIILITSLSLMNSVYETRCSHLKMNKMSKLDYKVSIISKVSSSEIPCEQIIDSSDLLPGDLLILRPGMVLPCDAIVLTSNIIVNESALTGESVPVLKSPIPKYSRELFDVNKDYKHVLYAKTIVMGVQDSNSPFGIAMVLKIGFSTLQGQFLQSMYCDVITNRLHFQNDKLYQDSMKFVKFCFIIGFLGCIVTAIIGITLDLKASTLLFRAFDLFTIVAPPALPATIAAGSTVAVRKLKKKKISCSNPSSVNIAGQVNSIVFDKTGTLTSDGLDAVGCISSVPGSKPCLDGLCTVPSQVNHLLSQAFATCHSISYVDKQHSPNSHKQYHYSQNLCTSETQPPPSASQPSSPNSRIIVGESLELCMFQFSGWILCDNGNSNTCLNNVKEFESGLDYVCSQTLNNSFSEPSNLDKPNSLVTPSLRTDMESSLLNEDGAVELSELPPPRIVRKYFKRSGNSHNFDSQDYEELEIIKVFEFCSKLRRMTVVCRNPLKPFEFMVFCKGSPEQIKAISRPESIPSELDDCVMSYSRSGMRVLGFSVGFINSPNRDLHSFIEALSRSEAEERLNFIGLMIFANKLRPSATEVISTLKNANVNCLMSTGDHVYTSIAVAQECGILSNINTFCASKKIVIGDTHGSHTGEECIKWTVVNSKNTKVYNSIHEVLEKYGFENIHWVVTGQCLRLIYKFHEALELEFLDLSSNPEKPLNLSGDHSHSFLKFYRRSEGLNIHFNRLRREIPCWISLNTPANESYSRNGRQEERDRLEGIVVDTDDGEEFIKFTNIPYHLDCTRNQKKAASAMPDHPSFAGNCDTERNMILNFDTTVDGVPLTLRISVLEFIIRYCHVYSRMTPEDKAMHINLMQKLKPNPMVGMCGDGNNDILAIKSANIGIAIADHEASIAASFVSNERNIAAVPDVLLEGRAALTSTIQSFQYSVLYIFIQFTSVLYLYSKGTNFTDHQYIWCDLVVFLSISIFATLTKSAKYLPPEIPAYKDILSSNVLIGIIIQCAVQLTFLISSITMVTRQDGFEACKVNVNIKDNGQNAHLQMCVENSVTFIVSCIQYVSAGVAIHKTRPFRLSLATNKLFLIQIILVISSTFVVIMDPKSFVSTLLNTVELPGFSQYILLAIFFMNFFFSIASMNFAMKAIYRREIHNNGPACFPQLHPLYIPKSRIEWKINTNLS